LKTRAATLETAVGARAGSVADAGWPRVMPLVLPCALLIVGGAVGYPFSLNASVAGERLLGLVVASALATVATFGLTRTCRHEAVLVGASLVALAAGAWVIAASGPDVFRGAVGGALDAIFRPLFGRAVLTDSVAVANTRFIVGYNGLADLCLVAIFCCGAVLLGRPRPRQAAALAAIVVASAIVLVGTGARGGLTGLAAGMCAIGLYAWPRRYALLALIAAPLALVVAAVGIFDKGLEFSSTAGRLTYWGDLVRLLVEYPLTGVGLGVDTAYTVGLQYEINPDPERVFYAHNTFVQTYLEQGPLATVGMLCLPVLAIGAALLARRYPVSSGRRALFIAGLGVVGGMEAHGLTDQVVTTNVGTGLVLLGVSAILAALSPDVVGVLNRWTARLSTALVGLAALAALGLIATPVGRAQVLLNLGGLDMNHALAARAQSADRSAGLAEADHTLSLGLAQAPDHPGLLRDLARVRAARFDDSGALGALKQATTSPRLDAFDTLQIAHVYRDLGFADEAYAWAARAYTAWGRAPEDAVMQVYAQSTLTDDRSRVLATQAEAAMRAHRFGEAHSLFEQALTFAQGNTYLTDRIGASQRAIAKYGPEPQ
jgi:O-Antigen ligase